MGAPYGASIVCYHLKMVSSPRVSRRQQSIMEFIRQHGAVQVEPLAEAFDVTPQTIRRDLNQLYELELVHRVHGGAVIKDSIENLGYNARKVLMADEKSAIAHRIAELIPNHSSLFINIGTTTEKVAEYLRNHKNLMVITNNINVANSLWPSRNHQIMIASGTIRYEDGGIVGPSTEDFIDKFKVDYAVIGCSAIDKDGEIYDYDLREVRVTQAIIQRSRSVILASDSMKFQRSAPVRVGNLNEIDYLVTDQGVPAEIEELCREKQVQLETIALPETEKTESRAH